MYYFKAFLEEYLVDVLSDTITQSDNGKQIRIVKLRCTQNIRGLIKPGQEFEVTSVVGMEHYTWSLENFIELKADDIEQSHDTGITWTIPNA
jgi:hypothetical protein